MFDQNAQDQQSQTDQSSYGAPGLAPVVDHSLPAATDTTTATAVQTYSPASSSPDTASDDLLSIKQEALQQLSPLVGHLEQTPEEKFRTTMMMIQASDDQNLIKVAYEAAKQIEDEKSRAQALLDVINEINYFTHQNK